MRHWLLLAIALCASARAQETVRVLALASDVKSCQELAAAVLPLGVSMAVVSASPETLSAIAADGAELRSLYDALFIQQGKDLRARAGTEFLAVAADAIAQGMGLVLEGGPEGYVNSGFEDSLLARYAPAVSIGEGTHTYRTGRSDRALVLDAQSPLLRFLGWHGSPPVAAYNLLYARRDATAHLRVDEAPLLLDWRVGDARIVQFAGGLCGAWAEGWREWVSFDAFRARLLLAAGGMDDEALKKVIAKGKG